MSPTGPYITQCDKDVSGTVGAKAMFKTLDQNNKEITIDHNLWETGYPKSICSKYAPVAVIINKRGRLQNFPSSASLPLLCGQGKWLPLNA